jgi:hypothetical protein
MFDSSFDSGEPIPGASEPEPDDVQKTDFQSPTMGFFEEPSGPFRKTRRNLAPRLVVLVLLGVLA